MNINIRRIKISNFYSFKDDQEVFFTADDKYSSDKNSWNLIESEALGDEKILPVTLFYGANAAGKTNLLHIFYRFEQLLKRKDKKSQKLPYSPFALLEGSPIEIEVEFVLNDVRYCYAISHDESSVISEKLYFYPTVSGKEKVVYEKNLDKFVASDRKISVPKSSKDEIEERISTRTDILALEILATNRVQPFYDIYKFFVSSKGRSYKNIGKILQDDLRLKQKVIDLLKYADIGICDIEIKTIERKKYNKLITFEKGLKDLLRGLDDEIEVNSDSFFDPDGVEYHYEFKHNCSNQEEFLLKPIQESAGTRTYLDFLIGFLPAFIDGGVFIVDEAVYLHPILLQEILKLFHNKNINKAGAQVILATHDVSIMTPECLRRDEIWFVEKDSSTGESNAYPLSMFTDVRKDYDYSKGYMQGRFGAIPFLGDIDKLDSILAGEINGKKKIISKK